MKKFLFPLALISILMIGCKETVKKTDSEKNTESPQLATSARAENTLNPVCIDSLFLILDKNKIIDYTAWRNDSANDNLVICESNDIIHISLEPISDNEARAEWLEGNGKSINYIKSIPYINNSHLLEEPDPYDTSIKDLDSITVGDIKKVFTPYDFEHDNYNQYICFKKTRGKIIPVKSYHFNPNNNTYSIPFIKSMIIKNGLKDSSLITFYQDKHRRIFFKAGKNFYNYSRIPEFTQMLLP